MTTAGEPPDTPSPGFAPPADVVARRLGESAVLIRMRSGRIYQLNATGARIWDLLQECASREAVLEALVAEFDVSREAATAAVDDLLARLRAEGLL